ncbi:uncharacterized protein PAC_11302 [Phialocephala subalpina]|uniref:Endosomal spry domain-containing protein n=1 Tax=Phialocephala subalpina TaxID=576137 RepID=A0A1L7X8T6_9HELO|nr:uncharacterized protein PAC_11302 [Phialocephala subalpina]
MAPLPATTIKSYLSSLLRRTPSPSPPSSPESTLEFIALHARSILPRSTSNPNAGAGVTPPDSIPNKFVFVVFGLIGLGFVVTGIWFFFWAKNGGFYFKENDWEDYKSTVLRRRGPNGTLLSGASESTDLGGGSIVHGEKSSRWGRSRKGGKNKKEMRYKDFDDEESQVTSSLGTSTVITGTDSELSAFKKKMKKGRKGKKDKTAMSEVGTVDEDMDASVADAIRSYRHEKPARVGGINKQPDGSSWDGSNEAASDLLSHREKTPTSTPTKIKKERKDNYTGGTGNGGIRKVVSTSTPSGDLGVRASTHTPTKSIVSEESERSERIKAEARKLQEKGRAATTSASARRDFSFQAGDDSTVSGSSIADEQAARREEREARRQERERRRQSRSPVKKVPGSYQEVPSEVGSDLSSDIGTKSYHHPIPGLSSAGSEYAEERRKKRNGGYRRGRTEDDEE